MAAEEKDAVTQLQQQSRRSRRSSLQATVAPIAPAWTLQQQQAEVNTGEASRRAGEADEHDETWVDFCNDSKPIIAAVHGYAVGVGVTTVLPFDFRIAGESAQFGFRFVKMGLLPEAASTTLLPRPRGSRPRARLVSHRSVRRRPGGAGSRPGLVNVARGR